MLHAICPVCKCPIERVGNCAVCKNGHTFDYAKEGYLNLLMPSKKHSQNPGDNKDMVLARKRFLDGGYYAPLADRIAQIVCDKQKIYPTNRDVCGDPIKSLTLIDAGVGTGYYLNKIYDARQVYFMSLFDDPYITKPEEYYLRKLSRACARAYHNYSGIPSPIALLDTYLGADISKTAVRYAAKLNPVAECHVASVYDLPYESGIADVVTCIFSPYALEEYKRVLKPDGILIIASPCENHLIELRRALYENVREVEAPLRTDGFEVVSEQELSYHFQLKNTEDIAALLMMTPYAYRAPVERKNALLNTRELSLTADFKVTIMKPIN